jgi:hypothetical protein
MIPQLEDVKNKIDKKIFGDEMEDAVPDEHNFMEVKLFRDT